MSTSILISPIYFKSSKLEKKNKTLMIEYTNACYYHNYSNSDIISMTHEKLHKKEKKKKMAQYVLQKNLFYEMKDTYIDKGLNDRWLTDRFVQPLKYKHKYK